MIKEFKAGNIIARQPGRLTLLDFYSRSCGPCKMMEPILEKVTDEIEVVKVCVDDHSAEARRWQVVQSLPTMIIIRGALLTGKERHTDADLEPSKMIVTVINGTRDSLTLRRDIAAARGK